MPDQAAPSLRSPLPAALDDRQWLGARELPAAAPPGQDPTYPAGLSRHGNRRHGGQCALRSCVFHTSAMRNAACVRDAIDQALAGAHFHRREMGKPNGPFKKWYPADQHEAELAAFQGDLAKVIGQSGLRAFGALVRIKDLY
jgi:hypothetical protein